MGVRQPGDSYVSAFPSAVMVAGPRTASRSFVLGFACGRLHLELRLAAGERDTYRGKAQSGHSRGSVNVFVQPPKDSFEAIAKLFFSSRSVRTWNSSSAPLRSSSI
ncbi:hypothetical protein SAMN05216533_0156 [Streptomyces sp. Ag109_O5-10]|nr:hypothetical protein SAMN05216533_0156 [Streptomyces sp. Ag109_O5-10]